MVVGWMDAGTRCKTSITTTQADCRLSPAQQARRCEVPYCGILHWTVPIVRCHACTCVRAGAVLVVITPRMPTLQLSAYRRNGPASAAAATTDEAAAAIAATTAEQTTAVVAVVAAEDATTTSAATLLALALAHNWRWR